MWPASGHLALWHQVWNQYHLFSFCLTLLKYLPVQLVLAEWAWFMPTLVLWTHRYAFKAGCIEFALWCYFGYLFIYFCLLEWAYLRTWFSEENIVTKCTLKIETFSSQCTVTKQPDLLSAGFWSCFPLSLLNDGCNLSSRGSCTELSNWSWRSLYPPLQKWLVINRHNRPPVLLK